MLPHTSNGSPACPWHRSRRARLSRQQARTRDFPLLLKRAHTQAAWTDRDGWRLRTDHQHEWHEGSSSMTELPDIQRIKRDVTIVRTLEQYSALPLKSSGAGFSGPCPIHGASKSSRAFHVSADGRAWYCFGACNRGGSVIDLVAALEGCSIKDAVTLIANRFSTA
jgi:hypothetical protein